MCNMGPFKEGWSRSSGSVGAEVGGAEVMASEEGVIEEESEEARRPRVAKRPQMPTKAEYDAHITLHGDYCDWCPDCVAGRGISHQQPLGMRGQEGNSVWTTPS